MQLRKCKVGCLKARGFRTLESYGDTHQTSFLQEHNGEHQDEAELYDVQPHHEGVYPRWVLPPSGGCYGHFDVEQ